MNNGAHKDYLFGAKNHWRRTLWNEILRRTAGRERTQPILYLAGGQDLDRKIAVEKGVPATNLIAVEREPKVIRQLQARGIPVVQGELLDVLWNWPKSTPVAAVLADYCCGLVWNVLGLYDCFQRSPLRGAVLAANFLRGRDAEMSAFRDRMTRAGLLGGCVDAKHRGALFAAYHAFDLLQTFWGVGSGELLRNAVDTSRRGDYHMRMYFPESDEERVHVEGLIWSIVSRVMQGRFYTYRSTSLQTFDSVVLWPGVEGQLKHGPEWAGAHPDADAVGKAMDGDLKPREVLWRKPSLARRIAARLAVRTMRRRVAHGCA